MKLKNSQKIENRLKVCSEKVYYEKYVKFQITKIASFCINLFVLNIWNTVILKDVVVMKSEGKKCYIESYIEGYIVI